jgi:large subunit ribosomal protein L28
MAKCDRCGKKPQFGHSVSHSHVKTNRRWSPNIQQVTVFEDGQKKRLSLCAKCLKTLHKTN